MLKYVSLLCFVTLLVSQNLSAQKFDFDHQDHFVEVSYELLEDRMSCMQSSIPMVFNEKVQSFIDYFTVRNRPYTKEVISNTNVYFPIFEELLAEYDMPDELKYLAVVESGLRPNAMSRVGAAGLWQFMPATGKSFGLKQSWYIDERMNPRQATVAACKYLRSLYQMFGDWEMALAAYNTGPGNVRKAIRRSGYKKTFWEVYPYLPRETRSYVPQFVAIAYTLNHAEDHHFFENELPMKYAMEYEEFGVSGYVHLETLANLMGLCLDDILLLNPQIIRGALPENTKNYPLKLPIDALNKHRDNMEVVLDSASKVGKLALEKLARNTPGSTYGRSKQVYRVRSGDVLGLIAKRHHVRVSDIKKWNRLNSNMIRVGQRLNIWVLPVYNSKTKSQYASVSNQSTKQNPSSSARKKGKYHVIQGGDTLWSIARIYDNVSIEKLKKWNKLSSSRIKPGQKLLIAL